MKMKLISAAVAFGAFAPVAGAVPTFGAFDTPDLKVFLTGATAPDNFLASIADGLFDANGYYTFQDDGGTTSVFTDDGRLFRAFYGTTKNDTSIPTALRNKKVLFIKRSKGGSVWGVNPVARAQRVSTLNLGSGTCVLNSNIYRCVEKGIDPGLAGYTNSSNAGEVSDFGVSDVEPALFKAPYNVEFGQDQLSNTEVARLDVKPANVLMMGIVATNSVPATTHLSRGDYGSMLNGVVFDWKQVDPSITTGNTQVVVCRRVNGSGTQTSYNWLFSNFPCQTAANGSAAPARMVDNSFSGVTGSGTPADPFVIDPSAGYTVVENSTSGNVRDCLTRAQNNTDHTFVGDDGKTYKITFSSTPGTPFRAIGVLSLDSFNSATPGTPAAAPTTGWSFRMLDGAGIFDARSTGATAQTVTQGPGTGLAPSKSNLVNGRYDFAVELTFQSRKVSVTNEHGDVIAAPTGLKKDFIDFFIARAGQPAFNTSPATAALPPAYDPTTTSNVAFGTRNGNTCSPLQRLFPTP